MNCVSSEKMSHPAVKALSVEERLREIDVNRATATIIIKGQKKFSKQEGND